MLLKIVGSLILIALSLIYVITYVKNNKSDKQQTGNQPSLYNQNITLNDIDGNPINFDQFKGKKLLIVNVASKCGFTPQYEGLETLHETYGDKVTVIGLPCNQFKEQEPGTLEDIKSFCSVNYGVSFLMTEKVNVKGDNQHPLYQWLTDKTKNGLKNSSVKWNFQKYLLDDNGRLIDFYYSTTKPMSNKIIKHLR